MHLLIGLTLKHKFNDTLNSNNKSITKNKLKKTNKTGSIIKNIIHLHTRKIIKSLLHCKNNNFLFSRIVLHSKMTIRLTYLII